MPEKHCIIENNPSLSKRGCFLLKADCQPNNLQWLLNKSHNLPFDDLLALLGVDRDDTALMEPALNQVPIYRCYDCFSNAFNLKFRKHYTLIHLYCVFRFT